MEGCVPRGEVEGDAEKTTPASFVVLASKEVMAFLDILPMVGGEFSSLLLLQWIGEFKDETGWMMGLGERGVRGWRLMTMLIPE